MSDHTITTQATATVQTAPDTAFIECCVFGDADSVEAARASLQDREQTIRESLPDSVEDIRIGEFTLEETSDLFAYEGDAQFRAKKCLYVECVPSDGVEVGEIVLDTGGTVESIRFTVSTSDRETMEDEALEKALDRSRAKAERLASHEDLSISGVNSITTGDDSGGLGSDLVDDALSNIDDNDFAVQPITVEQAVQVTYRLSGP